jgi:O-antigen/teichoic acid export membrane protein
MLLGNVLNYHATILRSYGDIAAVSSALMLQSVAGAGVGLVLVLWVGVWGLLWGWLVGTFLALLYARARSRGRVPLAPLPSRESRVLLGVGFPIFLFVSTTFVMRSLDRIVVLRFLGTTELGYYTLAVMAVTVLLYLSDSVSYVLYPRLVTRYRESGGDATAMCRLALRPLRTISLLLPWVTALAYLAADELVSWVLPAFRPGVSALRILSFGTVGLALGSIPAFTLITQGRMRQLVAVSVGGGLLALGLDLGAVAAGFGTKGIAAATLAAYFAYGALLQWLAFGSLLPRGAGRWGIILRLHAPLALAIALAYGVEHATPGLGLLDWQGLVRLLATLTLFTGLYVLAIRPFVAGLGLRGILAEFRMPGLAPERSAHGEGGA